ncbi:MAG TPA: polyprenyl synthetase family protein [Rubricoccaceae bacterium]|nr:polyprenyl synthetase family protein [Rubricoccaceae bacterium]
MGERTEAQAYLQRLAGEVEAGLAACLGELPAEPAVLYGPVRYVLEGGGKRIRPVLVLLAAEAFGGEAARRRALPAALAVEVFHNFTLVHDDIMDGAAERRGRPTVHVRWDAGTAILSGDLLMGLSYDLLARVEGADTAALVRRFHAMVLRLCEGQALDAAFERRDGVTVADYLDMIERKTGALLEAALEIGGIVGGAGEAGRAALRTAGRELGRAFQIQDDLLDLTAESDGWGKTIGGDLVAGKRTFLLLRALERAGGDERAWFARALDGGLPAAEVAEARARMDRLGVLDDARAAVRRHSDAGLAALAALPPGPAADALRSLAERLVRRAH